MASPSPRYDEAFARWKELLGDERASRDPGLVERYGRSNTLGSPDPSGVLRPQNREQVIALVKIAAETGVPLYSISRGQNWGYGAGCPPTPGQVVVDLRDVNRIVEVDAELGYAVVEPGVTFRQLYQHLVANDLPVWMDCTDSTPDTSVLGNIMERGMGFSPLGDRFANSCALEAVLADGTIVQSGFSHFPGARTSRTHKWGVGPSLDGIFTQSSFGIVLSLTVWLMPRPESFYVMFSHTPAASFERLIDTLRDLRLQGALTSIVHLNPATWMSPHAEPGSYYTIGAIYGPKRLVDAYRAEIEATLGSFATVVFTDPRNEEAFAGSVEPVLSAMRVDDAPAEEDRTKLRNKIVGIMRQFAHLHRGTPMGADLTLITPHPQIEDAELPRHGHYSYGPTCPASGKQVSELIALIGKVFTANGRRFTGPSMAFINARSLVFVGHVVFDRADPESIKNAAKTMDQLIDAFIANGFPPYRVGIQSMGALDPAKSGYWKVVRRLKAALDPDGIFAPGRYLPPA